LPDGIFLNQKSRFGQILEGLAMESAGILYVHLVYFMDVWYIFPRFGVLYQEKSGNPDFEIN
jgi:hypothetical protein